MIWSTNCTLRSSVAPEIRCKQNKLSSVPGESKTALVAEGESSKYTERKFEKETKRPRSNRACEIVSSYLQCSSGLESICFTCWRLLWCRESVVHKKVILRKKAPDSLLSYLFHFSASPSLMVPAWNCWSWSHVTHIWIILPQRRNAWRGPGFHVMESHSSWEINVFSKWARDGSLSGVSKRNSREKWKGKKKLSKTEMWTCPKISKSFKTN